MTRAAWRGLHPAADEGARLAREAGQTTMLASSLAHAARAAAVRGDATRFASAASEASVLASDHGLGQVESIAAHATALHEIGMGATKPPPTRWRASRIQGWRCRRE